MRAVGAIVILALVLVVGIPGANAQVAFTGTVSSGTCGNGASAQVLAANVRDRAFLSLVNDSSVTEYIAVGQAAVSGQGVRLNANGGAVVWDTEVPAGAVNCISTGAGNSVAIMEGVR